MPTKRQHAGCLARLLLWGFGGLLVLGCAAGPPHTELVTCQIVIDNVHAQDVRLTLFRIEAGQAVPVFEGTSAPDGIISLKPVGQAAPGQGSVELVGIIESTGSTEWQLTTPWSNPLTTPLKIQWPPTSRPLKISLPRKAIRMI